MSEIEKNTFLPGMATRAELNRLGFDCPIAMPFVVLDMVQGTIEPEAVGLDKESKGVEKIAYKKLKHGFPTAIKISVNGKYGLYVMALTLQLYKVTQTDDVFDGIYRIPGVLADGQRYVVELTVRDNRPARNYIVKGIVYYGSGNMPATLQDVRDSTDDLMMTIIQADMTADDGMEVAYKVFGATTGGSGHKIESL